MIRFWWGGGGPMKVMRMCSTVGEKLIMNEHGCKGWKYLVVPIPKATILCTWLLE